MILVIHLYKDLQQVIGLKFIAFIGFGTFGTIVRVLAFSYFKTFPCSKKFLTTYIVSQVVLKKKKLLNSSRPQLDLSKIEPIRKSELNPLESFGF